MCYDLESVPLYTSILCPCMHLHNVLSIDPQCFKYSCFFVLIQIGCMHAVFCYCLQSYADVVAQLIPPSLPSLMYFHSTVCPLHYIICCTTLRSPKPTRIVHHDSALLMYFHLYICQKLQTGKEPAHICKYSFAEPMYRPNDHICGTYFPMTRTPIGLVSICAQIPYQWKKHEQSLGM
jgi:hypothetical protein